MTGSLENIQRRIKSAGDLALVVRTMKAMAVSNMTNFEMAVEALQDYFYTVSLGMHVCLRDKNFVWPAVYEDVRQAVNVAIVFGSDQGLVGPFDDSISVFAKNFLQPLSGKTETWAVGERIFFRLADEDLHPVRSFHVPNSVFGITPLVNEILMHIEAYRSGQDHYRFFLFHNSPLTGEAYRPRQQRLFPVDQEWSREIDQTKWPSENLPQVIGAPEEVFRMLIREYLFVSIYKACAESMASENASRLAAMQRAEKNIEEMLDLLRQDYNLLRQSTIDEELFDVIAGFEALKKKG